MEVYDVLVIISALMASTLSLGLNYSMGNLFNDIMTTFEVSRTEAGTVQSIIIALGLGVALIVGLLIQKLGPFRVGMIGAVMMSVGVTSAFLATSLGYIIATVSVIAGCGTTCVYVAAVTTVGQRFKGKTSLMAVTIVQLGPGLGGMTLPYLLRQMADEYGLRGTLLLMGGVLSNAIPLVLLWRKPTQPKPAKPIELQQPLKKNIYTKVPTKEEEALTQDDDALTESYNKELPNDNDYVESNGNNVKSLEENCDIEEKIIPNALKPKPSFSQAMSMVLRNAPFLLYAIGQALAFNAVATVIVFLQDLYLDSGFTKNDATVALLTLNLVSILGRISPGFLFGIKWMPAFGVPVIASTLSTTAVLAVYFAKSLVLKIMCSCLVGISIGMNTANFGLMSMRFFDTTLISSGMGVTMTACGIVVSVLGPVSGMLRDSTGTYTSSVYLCAGGAAFSGLLQVCGHMCRQRSKPKDKKNSVV